MTAYDLHIGVTDKNWHLVEDLRLASDKDVLVDNDGWECWGEPLGTDVNDLSTKHVIIRVEGLPDAITEADSLFANNGSDLAVMARQARPDLNGIALSLTLAEDWAEEILAIHDDNRIVIRERVLPHF